MNSFNQLLQQNQVLLFLLFAWSLLWKGISLWRSARANQRNWFIALLVLNTVGILEIAYLFFFAKDKLTLTDLKIWEYFQTPSRQKKSE